MYQPYNNQPDNNQQPNNYPPYPGMGQSPYPDRRSSGMELAALVLGILSLSLFCCPYASLPCGALAIILALLSRGGERKCSSRGLGSLILGSLGLGLGLLFMVFAFLYNFVFSEDAWKNRELYLELYEDINSDSYEDIYRNLDRYLE